MELFISSIVFWKFTNQQNNSTHLLNNISKFQQISISREDNFNQIDNNNNNNNIENKNKKEKKSIKVAIIGSGLAGLSLGISLEKVGIEYTIYERDKCFEDRREGFGLTLTCGKGGTLDKLGVLDKCFEEDCPSYCHWVFTPSGKILGYYGRAFISSHTTDKSKKRSGNLRIPRQILRKILLDKIDCDNIKWNKKFIGCSYNFDNNHENSDINCNNHTFNIHFSDGTIEEVDVLIGADGLNSYVREWRDKNIFQTKTSKQSSISIDNNNNNSNNNSNNDLSLPSPSESSKRYLGVTAILGITNTIHPLIEKQGFYILDGKHRLFTMPYNLNPDGSPKCTMWQLSFSGLSEGEALLLKHAGPRAQLQEALNRTQGWMDPVFQMIEQTPLEDIWTTPLYDRPPMKLRPSKGMSNSSKLNNNPLASHITVIGDACHPMSMFKGQGANQALMDGPLLASWLSKEGKYLSLSISQRIQNFEREVVARSSPKVQASHEANSLLHSPEAIEVDYGFEGVDPKLSTILSKEIEKNNINSSYGENLEPIIINLFQEILKNHETNNNNSNNNINISNE